MAILKYGAVIVEAKGSVNGMTFQGGRSSPTLRTKPLSGVVKSRIKPIEEGQTNNQQFNFAQFATIVKEWGKLTNLERAEWASLLGIYTFVDKFGVPYNGTPFQIFTSMNLAAVTVDLPILTSAPIELTAFDLGESFTDFSLSGTWMITLTQILGIGQMSPMWYSRPLHPSAPISKARYVKIFVGTYAGPATIGLFGSYNTFVGSTPPLGSIFYVRRWTTNPAYPQIQFLKTFKIDVVA